MKEAKGIRVRCRRCGGKIVVLRPEAPSDLSAEDVVPTDAEAPSAEPKGGTSPAPEEDTTVGADLSGDRTEELFDLPIMDSGPERNPPVPEGKVFSGGRSHTLKYVIVAGISILLLAGGILYFGTTKPGGEGSGKLSSSYDIRDVKLSFEKQAASGTLFVIQGKVANSGQGPSGGIGIRVTLQGKDHQALAEKSAFAGNFLDEASLRKMDRARIDAAMSNRFGEGNVNKEIPPGKSLPFLVVFFDPPGGIEDVMVTASDAQ
jgi:hypothetical protein